MDRSDWEGLIGGFIVYFALLSVFIFYPALIISISIGRLFYGEPVSYHTDEDYVVLSFVLFVIISAGIYILKKIEQYLILLVLYLITAFPFLYILYDYFVTDLGTWQEKPLPINWLPFF